MRIGSCLALCLLSAPAFAQATDPDRVVRPYWWDQPVIEALGRSTVETAPNRASFSVAFVETDGSASKAMENAVATAKTAQEAIKKVAGARARVKSSVNIEPYYEQYRDKDGEMIENERADRVKGYAARVDLEVTLTDTALAGRARAAALALGPQNSDEIRFYLEETPELQLEAYEAAVKIARKRAETAAAAAGEKLGKLLVLQEGSSSCLGNWSSRQVARQVATSPRSSAQDAALPVQVYSAESDRVVVTGSKRERAVVIKESDIARLDLASDNDPSSVTSSVCLIYAFAK